VDNHSEDETERTVNDRHSECIYIRVEKNIGVGARNIGLKQARGDIIICLDDDVFGIDDSAVSKVIDIFSNNEKIGACNFKILDFYTGEQCNWIHHCEQKKYSSECFNTYEITEGAVAFRKKALVEAGFYPEYFFISHEGPDLAFRLINKGYDVIYTGDVVVRHCHSDIGRLSWLNYYYDTRNQYWLAVRNFPLLYALRYLIRGQISTLVYSIRDGFFRYWLKAVIDGLSGLPRAFADRKVVSKDARNVILTIDGMRPSLFHMIKNRVFKKDMRL